MLSRQTAPATILNSGAKSPLTKAFVMLGPFLDQTNTIIVLDVILWKRTITEENIVLNVIL